MSAVEEVAFCIPVAADECVAILHRPEHACDTGVVVVVGGPQYRVGSHRQFVVLARAVAAAGFPVLRFDYRGLGDSSGEARDFLDIDDDIAAAVDALFERTPVRRCVLWCLCDAASAALFQAHRDPRIDGLVLLNPWVHTAEAEAKARLSAYYGARLRSRDFWRRVLRFDFDFRDSLASLSGYVRRALARSPDTGDADASYVERMRRGLERFEGEVLLVLSGDDLTATEFRQLVAGSAAWRGVLEERVVRTVELPEANHTFARADWRDEVSRETIAWLRGRSPGARGA